MFIVCPPRPSQAPSERHVRRRASFNWLENVTLIVMNLMPFQKFQILFTVVINDTGTPRYSEDNVEINSCVGVSHRRKLTFRS
jgi:hypothetical protein